MSKQWLYKRYLLRKRLIPRFCFNFFEPCIAGEGIAARYLGFTLNKREDIVYKFIGNIVSVFGYPFKRNFLFIVCNTVERQQHRLAGIQSEVILTLKGDHLTCSAAYRGFNSVLADRICFLNVHR